MSVIDILVPQMGEGLQEVLLVEFFKKPGDRITRDEPFYSMETDKATMDVECPHEGVLVDDIVREWAARHGQEFRLELSGPAGGSWGTGDAELITMDAFDFCRILAGRKPATGLLEEQVPF